jgi:hypothetical protein
VRKKLAEDPDPTTDTSSIKDETIPHEAETVEAIDEQMRRTSDEPSIADLPVPSAAYVEAEAVAMAATINKILDVLREAELIPMPEGPS